MKVSAVIITFNEERNIGRCLTSLEEVVDEIVVVDSFSNDGTRQISEEHGVRFEEHTFEGHIEQKNYAISRAENDWVLSLDADEALTEELRESIMAAKSSESKDAFVMNRLTSYCGHWVRHGGWYPDKKVRLWNRKMGKWGGENPHDKVLLNENAKEGKLNGDLLHYSFYSVEEHVDQIQKFTSIAARNAFEKGKNTNFFKIIVGPVFRFLSMYFFKFGILDGYYGFVIAINSSFYKFLKEIKLRELRRRE